MKYGWRETLAIALLAALLLAGAASFFFPQKMTMSVIRLDPPATSR